MIAASSLAEDEARLFHVATTRARESLLVTAITAEDQAPSIFFEDFAEALGALTFLGLCLQKGRQTGP